MIITVKGVQVTLNKTQVADIERQIKKREAECRNLISVLTHFGFKKMNTKGWENPNQTCYQHPQYGWFADILDRDGRYTEVWLVGAELKSGSGMSAGWVYGNPDSLKDEITKALDKLNKS